MIDNLIMNTEVQQAYMDKRQKGSTSPAYDRPSKAMPKKCLEEREESNSEFPLSKTKRLSLTK